MPENIIEKIWNSHVVVKEPGAPEVFAIDVMLMHEVTSAQAFQVIRSNGAKLSQNTRLFATVDHSIPTSENRRAIKDPAARKQVETLRQNCKDYGVTLFDIDSGHQGIVHVVGPEQGVTQPGLTIVCGDSHTSTHGAFGALAFGVGTSEISHVLASGCILQNRPQTMRIEFKGMPPQDVSAKDVIMKLIATIGIEGANGHIVEYTGPWVESLSMESRMTLCNMSIECGARAGLVAPDQTTFNYLKGRSYSPGGKDWDKACHFWKKLRSDPGATYDKSISIDLSSLRPMITWGTNPEQAVEIDEPVPDLSDLNEAKKDAGHKALAYTGLTEGKPIQGTPVQWAFLGSCTNGRIEDLRTSAAILRGRKVHPDVQFYVVPGSEQVLAQAREEGLTEIFTMAGARVRMPGCSMCLGMNEDKVPKGERCISSSNRNFVGRQGRGSFTHLASPATVTESAIKGLITAG